MPIYKRVLPGLSPNQRYVVRVRAVSKFGVYSDWSEAIDFTTPSDDSTPNPPTDLSIDFESPDLMLDWIPPEFNTDGSFFRDFDHYDVTLIANSIEKTYQTISPFFAFTFAQNRTLFGTPQASIDVEIRAVDVSGKRSEPLTGTAINPAPLTPGNITGTATIQTIVLNFSPDPADRDIQYYLVERSLTGAPASFTQIAQAEGSSYLDQVDSEVTTYYYRYRVADYFGQTSPYSAVFTIDSVSVPGIDETPPISVQDFTIVGDGVEPSTHRAYIDVEWTPNNVDDDLASYEVRVVRVSDSRLQTYVQSPNASSYRIENLLTETDYELVMYAYDYSGNRSAASAILNHTTPADDSAPDTPINYMTIPANRSITVTWDPVDHIMISHYEVYGSTTSSFTPDTATFSNRLFFGNATRFTHNTGDNETWYFRLRAVNTNGVASAFTAEFSETSNDTFTRDTVPPAVPINISATSAEEFNGQVSVIYADITWDPVGDSDLAGYNVRLRRVGETRYEYRDVPAGNESAKFTVLADVEYAAQVSAYDVHGNYSAYSAEHTFFSAKDNVAPGVPQNPGSSTTLRNLFWYWDAVAAADLSHYEAQVDDVDNTFNSVVHTFTGLATGFSFIATAIQTYYMRVRAVDVSGNTSAWSTVATGTSSEIEGVDIDTQPPAIPSGLSLSTGIEVSGAKESIYINAAWTQNVEGDLAGYSVRLRRGSETRYEFRDVLAGNGSVKFIGLEPNTQYGVQIAAYDGFGNYSNYSTEETIVSARDQVAPGVPQDPVGVVSLRSVQWKWTDVNEADLAYYYAEVATDSGFVSVIDSYTGTSNSFTYVANDIDTYYMRVKAVDLSANESGWSVTASATTTTVEGVDLDTDPPDTPTGVTPTTGIEFIGQQENVYISVSWTSNAEPDLSGYSVRVRKAGSGSSYLYANVDASSNSARFTGLQANTDYTVEVAAYDSLNNFSSYSLPQTINTASDPTPPGEPTSLRLSAGIRSIIAQWNGVSDVDLKHYNVYVADTSNQNKTLYSSIRATMESINRFHDGLAWNDLVPGSTYYIYITAVDHSDNESTELSGSVAVGQAGEADIEDLAVTNAKIASLVADKITTGELNAVVTVSGTIRTASAGARMEMTNAGLIGYATNGTTENFKFDNSDGSITLVGDITTGSTISGSTITGGTFQTNATPTSNGIIVEDTNGFRAYESGVLNAQINRLGVATFKKATIAGSSSDVQLTVGTSNSILKIDSSGLYMGHGTFSSAPFRVTYGGALTASTLDITGTNSTISGSLTLNGASSRLRVGSNSDSGARLTITKDWTRVFPSGSTSDADTPTFEIDHASGDITMNQGTLTSVDIVAATLTGTTSITGATFQTNSTPTTNGIIIEDTNGFRAYQSGVLNAQISRLGIATFKKMTVVGTASDVSLTVGSSNSIWKVDSSGMYMGNATFGSAPFRVTYAGAVTATNITLGGGTINGAFNLNGASAKLRIGATGDTGARMAITQSWFRAFGSSSTNDSTDITFDINRTNGNVTIFSGTLTSPTITSGTITGGTFQTNSTPTTNGIIVNDASGFRAFNSGSLNAHISRTGSAIFNDIVITGSGMSGNDLIINTGNFQVQADGDVNASNITATGGFIGGVEIQSNKLVGGTIEGANFLLTNPGQIEFRGSGKITWNALATGGVELSGNGYINNSEYRDYELNGGSPKGWHVDETGIYIYDGVIAADAINIGGLSSVNLIENATFGPDYDGLGNKLPVARAWAGFGPATFFVEENGERLYQKTSQKVTATGTGNVLISQDVEPPETFAANEDISVSCWIKQTAGSARAADILVRDSGGNIIYNGTNVTLSVGSWVRIVDTLQLPGAQGLLKVEIRILSALSGDVFFVDGAQLERTAYPTDFKPAVLDIPNNYIDSAYISSLDADRIDSGQITAAEIEIDGSGRIYSDFTEGNFDSGWQIASGKATFYNGGIEIIGAGGANTDNGYVTIDSQSLRLMYGTGGSLTTQFKVDQSGVYIGGDSTSTADVYFDGDRTVFRSSGSGYEFEIDTTPEDNKILKLVHNSDEKFYLGTAGEAFFKGGIVDGVTINNNNTVYGTLVVRNVADTETLALIGSTVNIEDHTYHGYSLNSSDNVWGLSEDNTTALFRAGNKTAGGDYIEYKTGAGVNVRGAVSIVDSVADGNVNLVDGTTSITGHTAGAPSDLYDGAKAIGSAFVTFGSGSQGGGAESSFLEFDFGSIQDIAESRVYWYTGSARTYWYKIKYSRDGVNWFYARGRSGTSGWVKSTSRSSSSGEHPTIDRFQPRIAARYIRVYGDGSTANSSNHVYEVEFFARGVDDMLTVGTNFRVDDDGNLFATSGSFSGDITGSTGTFSGTISGATISGGTIDIGGNDSTSFHVNSSGQMWLGNASYSSAPFRVSAAGALVATNASITGSISGASTINIGDSVTWSIIAGTGGYGLNLSGMNVLKNGGDPNQVDLSASAISINATTSSKRVYIENSSFQGGTFYTGTIDATGNMLVGSGSAWIQKLSSGVVQTNTTVGFDAEMFRVMRNGARMLQLVQRDSSNNNTQIRGNATKSVKLTTDSVQIRHDGDTNYTVIVASSFNTGSDPLYKKDIARFTNSGSIIDNAPTFSYALRNAEENKSRRVGVLSTDLPDWLVSESAYGTDGVDIYNLVGILWEEVRTLRRRISTLEGTPLLDPAVGRLKEKIRDRIDIYRSGLRPVYDYDILSDEEWTTDKDIATVREKAVENRSNVAAKSVAREIHKKKRTSERVALQKRSVDGPPRASGFRPN